MSAPKPSSPEASPTQGGAVDIETGIAPSEQSVVETSAHERPETDFVAICRLDDLVKELGVAALLPLAPGHGPTDAQHPGAADADDNHQIALFRMVDDTVFAVQQHDPFAEANVLARGLVGTHSDEKLGLADEPVLSSPMYKQVWSLRTGECLDAQGKEPHAIRVYPTRVSEGVVQVGREPVGN